MIYNIDWGEIYGSSISTLHSAPLSKNKFTPPPSRRVSVSDIFKRKADISNILMNCEVCRDVLVEYALMELESNMILYKTLIFSICKSCYDNLEKEDLIPCVKTSTGQYTVNLDGVTLPIQVRMIDSDYRRMFSYG